VGFNDLIQTQQAQTAQSTQKKKKGEEKKLQQLAYKFQYCIHAKKKKKKKI